MTRTIAARECLEIVRDRRYRWAAAIVLLLLASALAAGVSRVRDAAIERAAAERHDRDQWLAQGERNPHSAAHFGRYAFKPSLAVSFLDPGVDAYLGVAIWLEAHYQDPAVFRPAEDQTSLTRLADLTVAFVLQVLLPLLVVFLGFNTFSGEREGGTLRLLLSLGVPARRLATGKILGLAVAVGLLVVPAALLGAGIVLVSTDAAHTLDAGDTVTRLAALALVYGAYVAVFLGISVAVSAVARSSRAALVGLLTFWLVGAFVVPRVVADLARWHHPAPSAAEFWRQVQEDMRQGIDGHDPAAARTREAERQLLAQYGVARIEDLPINFTAWSLQAGEEYGNQVFDKRYDELWAIFERQDAVHTAGAVLSPLLAVRSLSMALAGTDFAHHRHFAAAAETYRRALNKMMNEDYMYRSRGTDALYTAGRDLWEQAPDFEYASPSIGTALAPQGGPAMFLGGWCIVSLAAALAATRHIEAD